MTAIMVPAGRGTSFSVELRQATRDQHEHAERALDLPGRIGSPADLAGLLVAWRTVWDTVRSACGTTRDDEAARLLVSAVRAGRQINADLATLAVVDPSLDVSGPTAAPLHRRTHDLRELRGILGTAPGVWAASYVLRGSRVGGTVLAPLISQRLALPDGAAMEYFGDAAAGRFWVAFRGRLDQWARGAGGPAQEATIRMAAAVFGMIEAPLAGGGAAGEGGA